VKASRRHELRKRALLRTRDAVAPTEPTEATLALAPASAPLENVALDAEREEASAPRLIVASEAPTATQREEESLDDSVPPVTSAPEAEESERLFFDGDPRANMAATSEPPEPAEVPARISRIASPEAERRRKKASTYVALVFGACTILVASATARGLFRKAEGSASAQTTLARSEAPKAAIAAPNAPNGANTADLAAPAAATATAAPSIATAAATTANAAPAATTTASPDATPDRIPAAGDPALAKVRKKAAQQALERGKPALAIEEGEAAVALDPEDGESWLILGAAYQEKGDPKKAREAFTSCLKQGKRGPKGECAAMLR
jgi:cytochrome c-type biogenesis protein CcmH/NrfG